MGKSSKKEKKDKHKKKRRQSPSSSDSSSSDDEEEYKRRKAEKLAKKVGQHLKKHKVTGTGYTNEDNPFGDTNLTERFVWGKKLHKEIVSGRDVREMTAKAEMKRQAERLEEIEKVKKRREQRETEKAAMAEELEQIQRDRAIAEAVELEKKEEQFHLEQAKQRTQRRLASARPKAIDHLAHSLFTFEGLEPRQEDPYTLITGLTLRELKDLHNDIVAFKELDKHTALHRDYWDALELVADHELFEQQKQEDIDRAKLRNEPIPAKYLVREAGWHESIDTDVQVMLAGKRYGELAELERGIQDQLDSGMAADPEYWQAVLKRLTLHKAKARLRELHADLMQQHLARMMAGVDVPGAMGWEEDDQDHEQEPQAAAAPQQQQQQEEQVEEEEEDEEGAPVPVQRRVPLTAEQRAAAAKAKAAAADDNEIELGDEEDGEAQEPELDAELLALATAPTAAAAAAAGAGGPQDAAAAAAEAEESRLLEAARGEPRSWEDLSDDEHDGHREPGPYSPLPLPPTAYAGQDVIPSEEDARLLELMRAQIKYKEALRYSEVSAAQAAARPKQAEADRMFRRVMARPGEAHRVMGGGGAATRFLAEAAPLSGGRGARVGPGGAAAVPGAAPADPAPGEDQFLKVADRMMGDLGTSGDAPFGGEIQLDSDSQVYWWHEKYRPRRPKYFNRVHTGYEWNKYNQTHYDGDNPPPKTVQGYKFNIFYPELLDKTVAPTYKIDRDPTATDGETCILRFTAGPPYEDLAFKIINHEWEYNHKRGFKCVFERGILHLYFNFKRQRYRR